jgi:hypothetical protein
MAAGSAKHPIVVYASLGANFSIALTKFIVAALSGSSAMLSEGIHSVGRRSPTPRRGRRRDQLYKFSFDKRRV